MSSTTSAQSRRLLSNGNDGLIAVHPDVESVLITQAELQARVLELGKQITRDYADQQLILIGVLKGAAVFLSDLVRAIDLAVDYDFVRISSYGDGTRHSGSVSQESGWKADVAGKHVLVVEDIVDTGWTLRMSQLEQQIASLGAASVRICTLLDKPARREVEVPMDYRGFEIEDKFVVGYGLDWAGRYRNLPYIGVLRPEVYSLKR